MVLVPWQRHMSCKERRAHDMPEAMPLTQSTLRERERYCRRREPRRADIMNMRDDARRLRDAREERATCAYFERRGD